MTTVAGRRRLAVWQVLALLALLVGAAVIGAYLDWLWWHPTKGILVTLVAIGLLVLAGLLAIARRPLATLAALGAAAVGAGLLIGQAVGPAREPVGNSTGTMTVRFEEPVASEASGPADCQTVPSGEQLQVSGDVNTRLPLEGMEEMEYPFIGGGVAIGDMWAPEQGRRDDEIAVSIYLNSARVVEDAPTEVWLRSDPSSELELQRDGNSGSIAFSGLVVGEGDPGAVLGADVPFAGTITWTCPG